jgi:hypothetical protein
MRSNISRNDEIWSEITYKNYSSGQLYKKYRKIMEERQRMRRLARENERAQRRAANRALKKSAMIEAQGEEGDEGSKMSGGGKRGMFPPMQ